MSKWHSRAPSHAEKLSHKIPHPLRTLALPGHQYLGQVSDSGHTYILGHVLGATYCVKTILTVDPSLERTSTNMEPF